MHINGLHNLIKMWRQDFCNYVMSQQIASLSNALNRVHIDPTSTTTAFGFYNAYLRVT